MALVGYIEPLMQSWQQCRGGYRSPVGTAAIEVLLQAQTGLGTGIMAGNLKVEQRTLVERVGNVHEGLPESR